jgi:tRNA-Thr(GGU) m(6)t(6)A37 methyltransferase TsaA
VALNAIAYDPIGVVHSPHRRAEDTPIQPVYARGVAGTVEVFAAYEEGLQDIEGYSHLFLLYAFHVAGPPRLTVLPYLEDTPHGVFATRAPCRPNAIGLSVVRLVQREGRMLRVEDIDILDGTPLLDIKPFVGRFDVHSDVRSGWHDGVDDESAARRGRRQDGAK